MGVRTSLVARSASTSATTDCSERRVASSIMRVVWRWYARRYARYVRDFAARPNARG